MSIKEHYKNFRQLFDNVYAEISDGNQENQPIETAKEIICENNNITKNQKEMNDFFTSISCQISSYFPQLESNEIVLILGVAIIFTAFFIKAITDSSPTTSVIKNEALCLVVNAKHIHGLKKDKNISISIEEIKKIIDEAKYFLCTSQQRLNEIEENLRLRNEDPLNYELENFYISIIFRQELNMIGETRKYIIKDKIEEHYHNESLKIRDLKYLETVENFTKMGFTRV